MSHSCRLFAEVRAGFLAVFLLAWMVPGAAFSQAVVSHFGVANEFSCSEDVDLDEETDYEIQLCGGVGCTRPAYDAGCFNTWRIGQGPHVRFFPTTDVALGDRFSIRTVDNEVGEVETDFVTTLSAQGHPGQSLVVEGPLTSDCVTGDVDDPADDDTTQMVHGIVIEDDLGLDTCDLPGFQATVILPPNWNSNGSYPIVAWSNWDLATWTFDNGGPGERPEGQRLAEMIALSGLDGTGAIGVIWNGGGARGMFSFSETNHLQFRRLMAHVEDEYGGDLSRVIVYGGSRGGMAALAMGSAPALSPRCNDYRVANYTVHFVTANAAIGWFGERKRDLIFDPTYPISYKNWTEVIGFHDSWRGPEQTTVVPMTAWEYPAAVPNLCVGFAGDPDYSHAGKLWDEASWDIFMGRSDFLDIDTHPNFAMSAGSPRLLRRLAQNGTEVFLEVGTHDKQPYILKMEYARELQREADDPSINAGDIVEVDVLIGGGHSRRSLPALAPFTSVQRDRVWTALLPWIDNTIPPGSPLEADKLEFYHAACNANNNGFDYTQVAPDVAFPFTMEGPARIWPGQEFSLVFAGEAGMSYRLQIEEVANGDIHYDTLAQTLGNNGYGAFPFDSHVEKITLGDPPNGVTTELRYRLRVRRPGDLEPTVVAHTPALAGYSPGGDATLLWEVPDETNISGIEMHKEIIAEIPRCGNDQTNWGLYEFDDMNWAQPSAE